MMKTILKGGILAIGIVASLVLITSALGQSSGSPQTKPAAKQTVRQLEISNKPWTGDFDQMPERRMIRALVPYSRSLYFNDKGRERGITRRQRAGIQPDRPFYEALKLTVTDIPNEYLNARAAYLCPMELMTQAQMIAGLKLGTTHTFILDAAPATMTPAIAARIAPAPRCDGVSRLAAGAAQPLPGRNA